MNKFVQFIEHDATDDQVEQMKALSDRWDQEQAGGSAVTARRVLRDRENGKIVVEVTFPSYEAAQANNDLPSTQDFAREMTKIIGQQPTFRNLDVIDEM